MTAAEFFNWWRTQLGELVPAKLRSSWHSRKTAVALKIHGNRLELSAPPADSVTAFELPADDHAPRPQALTEFLSGLSGTPQRIRLTLTSGEYLSSRLTLPRAAQAHLAEAVRYQLPQLTPFNADQLYYACGETADSPAEGPLSVWLIAMPRQHIDRALALIGQSVPNGPLPLRTPPSPGENLELSWSVTEASTLPRNRRQLAWLGLIGLWVGVAVIHLYNWQQGQAELDQILEEVHGRAREVGDLRDRLTDVTAQLAWVAERKQSAVSALTLLNTLSEQLDDGTWLQGLDLQGRRLTLRGISSSPATVIETLEKSTLLKEVRFDAAITRDARGQGDRFNVSAKLEPAPEGDGT
jgi:Tfp pilus assembly protein PilN